MSPAILSKLGMLIVEDFLDTAMCARLREEARQNATSDATIFRKGGLVVDETVRSTKRARVSDEAAAQVKIRLLALQSKLEAHFGITLNGCQDPQFLIYREGDFFHPHRDNDNKKTPPKTRDDSPESTYKRQVSVIIFLNGEATEQADAPPTETFSGGSLILYGLMKNPEHREIGFPLTAKTGLMIAFPSDKIHEVTPVTQGERFTVVGWFT